MLRAAILLAYALAVAPVLAQQAPPLSPFAGVIAEYLRQEANGHSPTADDISAMATLQPPPNAASVREALPLLLKALDSTDSSLRTFALTALLGLQAPAPLPSNPAQTNSDPSPNPPSLRSTPPSLPPDLQRVLAPAIPQLAAHLVEESQDNRLLAVEALGSFTPTPPPAVYPPLLAFLRRDDAVGSIGLAVTSALLQFSPVSGDAEAAIVRYLRRTDQTSESRTNLVDTIAQKSVQSQAVDAALLAYLGSDDDALRARVILSLPQLDLAPTLLTETRSRISQLAANQSENLQVVTAAKNVTSCWTATKMTSGCPAY